MCPRSESPGTYMPAIEGELVLGGSGDGAGRRLDQADDDRMRDAAGANCGHCFLSPHAQERCMGSQVGSPRSRRCWCHGRLHESPL